ncbi:uncharacterized protein BX664DRAFT_323721 [Halteromyces radiatus]|uniref:uncharacterized protein n=1 Tax=Halteromyces radiatus TaxID=101107 RepID=UPI00221FF5CE|nr:uncharacterized protein BX664DRAFT_323721 [Halteromyces radiatus]KAI8096347.1 hypothetical protein BX664DRAFT_323721 [Halteromyces radiatus]
MTLFKTKGTYNEYQNLLERCNAQRLERVNHNEKGSTMIRNEQMSSVKHKNTLHSTSRKAPVHLFNIEDIPCDYTVDSYAWDNEQSEDISNPPKHTLQSASDNNIQSQTNAIYENIIESESQPDQNSTELEEYKVKLVKPERFEDLRSEAMQLWTSGIDLSLENSPKRRKNKKASWLTMEEFASLGSATQEETTSPAFSPKLAKAETPSSFSWLPSGLDQGKINDNSCQVSSGGEIISELPPLHSSSFTPHSSNHSTGSVDEEFCVKKVQAELIGNISKGDLHLYQYLDALENNVFGENTRQSLKQTLPVILKEIHQKSHRTFVKFIAILLLSFHSGMTENVFSPKRTFSQGQGPHNIWVESIMNILIRFTSNLMTASRNYIQEYAVTPYDMKLILVFLVRFIQAYPNAASTVPLETLVHRFQYLQPTFLPRICKDIQQHMDSLARYVNNEKMISPSPSNVNTWTNSKHKSTIQRYSSLSSESSDNTSKQIRMEGSWSHLDLEQVRPFLKKQLSSHQDHLLFVVERAIGCVPTKECLTGNIKDWIVLRKVRRYPTAVLSPVTPDIVFVYECDDQETHIMRDGLIGCVAIVIPDVDHEVSPSPLVGTTIQYASKSDRNASQHLIAIKHEDYTCYGHFTLILTSINASPLLPLIDWLKYAQVHLEFNHFSYQLVSYILPPDSKGQRAKKVEDESTLDVPDYFGNLSLDVSTIMLPAYSDCKANISQNSWPQLQSKHLKLPVDQRPPLYSLSNSQVSAIQYALSHRLALISGGPGTGKTYLAGKLLGLVYQAIKRGHIGRPILVMTSSESTLDTILSMVQSHVQDIIRFGKESNKGFLAERDGLKQVLRRKGESSWKQYRQLLRELGNCQGKIKALENHRQLAVMEKCPTYVLDLMPPTYREAFITQYHSKSKNTSWNDICTNWLLDTGDEGCSLDTQDVQPLPPSQQQSENENQNPIDTASNDILAQLYFALLDRIALQSSQMQRNEDCDIFFQQQQWIDRHPFKIIPLSEGQQWPFSSDSIETGDQARRSLMDIWSRVNKSDLWQLTLTERKRIYDKILEEYVKHLDKAISDILQTQNEILAALNDIRIEQWQSTCQFNRIIGMTTSFAMSNPVFVNKLSPHVVIVDEANGISGAFLAAVGLSTSTEHVILFGDVTSHTQDIPSPSFFDEWKQADRPICELHEQWRMQEEILQVWQAASNNSDNTYHLVKTKDVPERVRGMKYNTYLIEYKTDTKVDNTLDQERFVTNLALYIYQQNYLSTDIMILVTNSFDLSRIRSLVSNLSKSTSFATGFENIQVEDMSTLKGKEAAIVLLLIDSPTTDCISTVLSRAKIGLYIVSNNQCLHSDTSWQLLANYMNQKDLRSSKIPVICENHPQTQNSIGHWNEFTEIRNGGCSLPCTTLLDCGHICQESCHYKSHSILKCNLPCERPRANNCQHPCTNPCHVCQKLNSCPPCEQPLQLRLPCDHQVEIQCHEKADYEKSGCQEMVMTELACGHYVPIVCNKKLIGDYYNVECNETVEQVLECGHTVKGQCSTQLSCTATCSKVLECGHPCIRMCSEEHDHERKSCTFSCPKRLICGHPCTRGCANPDYHTIRCLENCERLCSHGYKCGRKCWETCPGCLGACPNKCPHSQCTKKCFELCDRSPCDEPCPKILACKHPCRGICGEPCTICPVCFPDIECHITLRKLSEFDDDEKIYTLPDCGCSFAASGLDQYFKSRTESSEDIAIKLWTCPTCQIPINIAPRYSNIIKAEVNLVNDIKEQQEKIRQQLTLEEKLSIINAMNEETGYHGILGGRWFVCKYRHPYYIGDCGGATEISKCPQCNEEIGGLQHQVVETNRFYGEFDGSLKPAWPGQPLQEQEND